MILSRLFYQVSTGETEIVGGWLGEQLDEVGNSITQGLLNGFIAILNKLCELSFWVSKVGIVCCMLIFYVSADKKAVSTGLKLLFIYIILSIINNQVGMF
jgi:hypothetical protein